MNRPRRPWWLYAVIAYILFELGCAVFVAPRAISTMRKVLEPAPLPQQTYNEWTMPPIRETPLPCSKFVHPDPLQCVKGK